MSIRKAVQNIQSVKVSCQIAQADANINRDIEQKEGYWLGENPEGYSNKTVPIIKFSTSSENILAIIYSLDIQSSIVESIDRNAVSSDLMGLTTQIIEEFFDCTALFMLGASADQIPRIGETVGFQSLKVQASDLANLLISQIKEKGKTMNGKIQLETFSIKVEGQEIPGRRALKPTRNYTFIPSSKRSVDISLITMNDLAIVMMRPEITSNIGKIIQEQSPYLVTMIATMINGGQKYMADKSSYDCFTYEAMNSMVARGSAEIVSQAIVEKLKDGK